MQTITTERTPVRRRHGGTSIAVRTGGPVQQAFTMLYLGYIALPILAGADKFLNYLTDWDKYLSPYAVQALGGNAPFFMRGVGVVEICAGLLVAVKPRIGGLVVAAWLAGIIVNLLSIPGYFDIALRDLGLCLGALALSRLSAEAAP